MIQKSQDKLFKIANPQQGYFTSKQAVESGYKRTNHPYHVTQGHWIRVIRGVYRLAKFPQSAEGQYVTWSLWSRDCKGNIQGVFSHETALSIYDVSDVMPAKLHMTVPKNFRRSTPTPGILVLHKNNLQKDVVIHRQGYCITSPLGTLLDIIANSSLEEIIIKQAIDQFKNKGMITKKEIYKIIEQHPTSAHYFMDLE